VAERSLEPHQSQQSGGMGDLYFRTRSLGKESMPQRKTILMAKKGLGDVFYKEQAFNLMFPDDLLRYNLWQ